jgi:hypothetical protein
MEDTMPTAAPSPLKATDATPLLRFPCGHVDRERTVERRARSRTSAIWVACERCNLTALIVGDTTEPRRRPLA